VGFGDVVGAMVGDLPQPGLLESGLAGLTDLLAAAVVLVVGGHVADAGMQPDTVVVLANPGKLGPQVAGRGWPADGGTRP